MVPKTNSCVDTNSDNKIWPLIEEGFIGYAYKRAFFCLFSLFDKSKSSCIWWKWVRNQTEDSD